MKLLTALTFAVVLMFGCSQSLNKRPYTSDSKPSTIYDNMISSIHTIKTNFFIKETTGVLSKHMSVSTSFHIGSGYLVTATHCVYFTSAFKRTQFGMMETPIESFGYTYAVKDERTELVGMCDDVALLYTPSLIGSPSTIWGNSDNLTVGTPLILIGNSWMKGINVKLGIVSRLGIKTPILELPLRTAGATFITTAPVNGGDSGGPIFMVERGIPVVIGMVYAEHLRLKGYGYAFKSEYILNVVEDIKRDVRYH